VSVYDIVTEKIIEKLEEGVVPWRRPWTSAGLPVSWQRQREYRGINTLLLEPGEYATFKQIQEAGGRVKKGKKGQIVVFWKMLESKEEEEEEATNGKTKYGGSL
jgi:antirestriction protein ArdC